MRHKTTVAIDLEFVDIENLEKRIFRIYRNIVNFSVVSLDTEKQRITLEEFV
jgi:hypothetical protein